MTDISDEVDTTASADQTADALEQLTVVVPIDFSEPSRRALDWAFEHAIERARGHRGCDLHLLHVVERHVRLKDLIDTTGASLRAELDEVQIAAQAELARIAPDAELRGLVGQLHHHVAVGRPAEEIVHLAGEIQADLIVMGTHGLSGAVERLFVGSVAQKVVRSAPCTVVSVKRKSSGATA